MPRRRASPYIFDGASNPSLVYDPRIGSARILGGLLPPTKEDEYVEEQVSGRRAYPGETGDLGPFGRLLLRLRRTRLAPVGESFRS